MKKSDLKDGMQVQYRKGWFRFVKEKILTDADGHYVNGLDSFNDNLIHKNDSDLDIVKVYELKELWQRQELVLTEHDIEVLKAIRLLYPIMNWVARDSDGDLFAYGEKPQKIASLWSYEVNNRKIDKGLLPFIKWEDEQPYNIDELLKGVK